MGEELLGVLRPRLPHGDPPGREVRGRGRRIGPRRLAALGQPVARQRGRRVPRQIAARGPGPMMLGKGGSRLAQQRLVHRREVVNRHGHAGAGRAAAAADGSVAKRRDRRAQFVLTVLSATDPAQQDAAAVRDRHRGVHGKEAVGGQLDGGGLLCPSGAGRHGQPHHDQPACHLRLHDPTAHFPRG